MAEPKKDIFGAFALKLSQSETELIVIIYLTYTYRFHSKQNNGLHHTRILIMIRHDYIGQGMPDSVSHAIVMCG